MRGRGRLALAPDTAERHLVASRLLGSPGSVLDVGGVPGALARFLADAIVTTANVAPPADFVLDGPVLPFADASFDAVVSLDVLEHIGPEQRAGHLRELRRVARDRVVAASPLGGQEHETLERELRRRYPGHPYLDQHARHGLPVADEVRALALELSGGTVRLVFHGDARRSAARFRHTASARRGRPAAALLALVDRIRPYDLSLSEAPDPLTNRVFLCWSSENDEGRVSPAFAPGSRSPR